MVNPPARLFPLCCLLLSCASIGAAPSALPTIKGVVVGPDGRPAPGAQVLVVSRQTITSATSDKSGKFLIDLANPRWVFG